MGVIMKYKAVIFDLDGTLLDTISDISDSFNATLEKYKYPTFSEEEYKYFVGKGIDVLISRIIKRLKLNNSKFEQLKQGYIEEYALRHNTKTKLYFGIMELLQKLKEKQIIVSILSNKPHFQTIDVIAYYFKDYKFDLVYGKKPEFEIKPNPASAIDLISNLNVNAKEVLYIGDTNTDIQTAQNAGFDSVGVLWGFRKKQELIDAGADYIVKEPIDIYNIIVGDGDDFRSR
jgi:phosphoglycolate phosphatase